MPTEQTNIIPGTIVEGKVQGITKFGAFIELPGGTVGLVHISEIADTYVRDVKDFIQEGQSIKVKVLNVSGNKIGLSMKQAVVAPKKNENTFKPNSAIGKPGNSQVNRYHNVGGGTRSNEVSLDDKIAKFLKESDERMQPLKNRMEPRKRNRNY